MACNQNGKTYFNSLTPYPGGTEASTTYLLDCTHYTCGNRQMCVNSADGFPLASNFNIQVLGLPRPVGDSGEYCCDVRLICDLTYQQVAAATAAPTAVCRRRRSSSPSASPARRQTCQR